MTCEAANLTVRAGTRLTRVRPIESIAAKPIHSGLLFDLTASVPVTPSPLPLQHPPVITSCARHSFLDVM